MTTSTAKSQAVQRFVLFDGLRGAAALAVVTVHARSPTLLAVLPHAPLAVDFFFVLSGFVIAHAYGERFRSGLSTFDFMRARLVRFWPMLCAAFSIVLAGHIALAVATREFNIPIHKYLASLALGLAFLPAPPSLSTDPDIAFPLVGPAYSMFLELSANLVFALIAARLRRWQLIAIVLGFAALLIAATEEYGTIVLGWPWYGFAGSLPRVGFSFFAGVLLYDLWRRWQPHSMPAWASFATLLAIFGAPLSGPWFELSCAFAAFPALVLFSAGSAVTGRVGKACLTTGAYSYGFYLLHAPVIRYVETAMKHFGLTREALDVWLVVLVVALSAAVTVVVTHTFERPLRRALTRLVGGDIEQSTPSRVPLEPDLPY